MMLKEYNKITTYYFTFFFQITFPFTLSTLIPHDIYAQSLLMSLLTVVACVTLLCVCRCIALEPEKMTAGYVSSEPLCRINLTHLPGDEDLLTISVSHAIFDGDSYFRFLEVSHC